MPLIRVSIEPEPEPYTVPPEEEAAAQRAERRQRLRREADEWLARKVVSEVQSEALDSEG